MSMMCFLSLSSPIALTAWRQLTCVWKALQCVKSLLVTDHSLDVPEDGLIGVECLLLGAC